MTTTQNHLKIADIMEDLVFLKDGGAALVMQTSAVNFGLLSEREQIAIIQAFAQMLNSLSFAIQIVIESKKLDITNYLALLDKARAEQTNTLLSQMIERYKNFIISTVKENEVLDKRFFIIIPVSSVELGLHFSSTPEEKVKKTQIVLLPRRDQILKQLGRVGLKANQLKTKELLELFFEIYNQDSLSIEPEVKIPPLQLATQPQIRPAAVAQKPLATPPPTYSQTPPAPRSSQSHPFVVEELTDSL